MTVPDPRVREVGRVEDMEGIWLTVGVSYDCVTLGAPDRPFIFTRAQVEELAHLIVAASWEAADCGGRMAAET